MRKQVSISTHHKECPTGKYNETKSGTIIAKGWHNNYADFEASGLSGCVTFLGDRLIIEVGQSHRWQVSFKDLLSELVTEAKADQ